MNDRNKPMRAKSAKKIATHRRVRKPAAKGTAPLADPKVEPEVVKPAATTQIGQSTTEGLKEVAGF